MIFPFETKWAKPEYNEVLETIYNWLGYKKKVLDVGCGYGELVYYLDKQGFEVEGVEIKKFDAWKHFSQKFKVFDGKKLDYEDNSFDAIILNNVIEHVKFKKSFFMEIKRVLKENGYVIIITPSVWWKAFNLLKLPKYFIGWIRGYGTGASYWFVHAPEVYGNNYFAELIDFFRWKTIISRSFCVIKKTIGCKKKMNIFLCVKRKIESVSEEELDKTGDLQEY